MKELGWNKDNPFMPDLKTVKDVKEYIAAGGIGAIEARIERAFSVRFGELKEKISRLFDIELNDPFLANLLLTSILVDTRALFLESDRQKRNATLQNVYRSRRMDDRAAAVDAHHAQIDRLVGAICLGLGSGGNDRSRGRGTGSAQKRTAGNNMGHGGVSCI